MYVVDCKNQVFRHMDKYKIYLKLMATIGAFVDMVSEFLNELSKSFPEEKQIKEKLKTIESFSEEDKQTFFKDLCKEMKTNEKYITNKSSKLFKKGRTEFFDSLKMAKIWKHEKMDDETREAIWKYINTIYVLCTTVDNLPEDLIKNIEVMAQECAAKMKQEDIEEGNLENILQNLDMKSLMSGMQNILGNK